MKTAQRLRDRPSSPTRLPRGHIISDHTQTLDELLRSFQRDIERRQAAEATFHQNSGPDRQEALLQEALRSQMEGRDDEMQSLASHFESTYETASQEWSRRMAEAEQRHQGAIRNIENDAARATTQLEHQRDNSAWVVTSVLDDTADDSPAREFERFKSLLLKSREDQIAEWTALDEAAVSAMEQRGWSSALPAEPLNPPGDRDAAANRFSAAAMEARHQLKKLNALILPKLFRGFRPLVLFFALASVIGFPVYLYGDPRIAGAIERLQPAWIGMSAVAGAIGSLLLTLVLYTLASMRQSETLRQLQDARGEALWAHQHWLKLAKDQLARQQKDYEAQQREIQRNRQRALKRYESAHREKLAEIETEREKRLADEKEHHAHEFTELTLSQQQELAALQRDYEAHFQAREQFWNERVKEAQTALQCYQSERRRTQQELWSHLKLEWERGWQSFESELKKGADEDAALFPPWAELVSDKWQPPLEIPKSIRVGEHVIDLNAWEGAISDDARLAPRVSEHRSPMSIPFPAAASVLFKSPNAQARTQALLGLQSLMLRLLTLLPPGKLRFTIIDPVGLGESFGGFMHLADYDELLVTSRIWTEASQIEARLADLTEHMENVLQKYLRNEFQTIEEYNESAGEVAEPYHILVISDFPAKFSEIAARRLVSIVNSGPRCGVYTLLNLDPTKQLPNNFHLSDIQSRLTQFEWRDGSFRSQEASMWPVLLDAPPPPETFTSIVKMVGDASKDARRVEVSFSRIAPPAKEIWTRDSRSELVIPLGRAGATKLQQLRLGKGTSQHMLVAGKTGSGKSTFLHILITNLSLYYSPDEVNFFLIDFKKGVEFKDYATHQLPHAKVIAVESDREFGVSALQKLDDVLQERGELFRKQGVQDIAGYRNATGRPLPRILLIIDEFQEFFVEDDKISQTAALLLDRLVRQGRAFGIHVVLGSQTLGGAYSLARSTLGQVAIRVALQCSEADAHLILSEDNTAARLLTRPGEAIYNDANGMLEGNHPFQIAWVTDAERESALAQMHERMSRKGQSVEPAIVFEGNIPSDLTRNMGLSHLVDQYHARGQAIPMPKIWLGDSVEIAPPTAITFQRQSGNHLLLVGQDADAAQGVMAAALLALAASLSPRQELNSLFVLDGSPPASAESVQWENLARMIPADPRIVRPEETPIFLQAISQEQARREEQNDLQAPPIFLLIYNIAKFRDLRKGEDDFGFSSFGGSGSEKPPEPGKVFADLLARGPGLGIHAIIWCDSYNNVDRWFSRQTLKELELRIAFQMNASDSSNLIDSPAAARLGTHRALLYREETGTAEKFRPYGLPAQNWWEGVRQRMLHGPDESSIADLEEFSIL
jgi:hypothetical protein